MIIGYKYRIYQKSKTWCPVIQNVRVNLYKSFDNEKEAKETAESLNKEQDKYIYFVKADPIETAPFGDFRDIYG